VPGDAELGDGESYGGEIAAQRFRQVGFRLHLGRFAVRGIVRAVALATCVFRLDQSLVHEGRAVLSDGDEAPGQHLVAGVIPDEPGELPLDVFQLVAEGLRIEQVVRFITLNSFQFGVQFGFEID